MSGDPSRVLNGSVCVTEPIGGWNELCLLFPLPGTSEEPGEGF